MKKGGIKNIVFDFGGIFIDLNQELAISRMSKLMDLEFNSIANMPIGVIDILEQYEMGKVNTETMIWTIQHYSTLKPQGLDIIKAWNSMLIGMKSHKFDKLADLRKDFNIYLLSNINDLHLEWIYNYFKRTYDILDWDKAFFDKTYYSHLLGMRKPNKDIFEHVWKDANLGLKDTLFVDDTLVNIEAANSLGIRTLHHDPLEDIFEVLEKHFD